MIYDYIENNPEWEPWAAKITGMIMEREDMIVSAIMDSREMLDDNILRAREVLKTDGWVLVTKKNGDKTILRVEKRTWEEPSEDERKANEERERRRDREVSSSEDDNKTTRKHDTEENIAHLIGTCLGEEKQDNNDDKGEEQTRQVTETEGTKDEAMEIPEGETKAENSDNPEGWNCNGEEGAESEVVKERDEEESGETSGETSMTETAGGELIPRRDKPAEGEVEETEKGYADELDRRPAKGEIEETEAGYAKAEEAAKEREDTYQYSKEKERWADNGWVTWKQDPENGKWSEEEVRAKHERDNRDRATNYWGGRKLDREPDSVPTEERLHKYICSRGTRAGFGNRMANETHDRWTQQYVLNKEWRSHWKYRNWERSALKPGWRTEAQWETSEAWNNEALYRKG